MDKKIALFYRMNEKEFELEEHNHNSHEIVYIIDGKSMFEINGHKYSCGPNTLIFISNFESHKMRILQYPYSRYYLLIDPGILNSLLSSPLLASIFKYRPNHFNHTIILSENDKPHFTKLFQWMHTNSEKDNILTKEYLMSCFNLLLIDLYNKYNSVFPILQQDKSALTILEIQEYIDSNFTQDIRLNDVADKFYINLYTVSRNFKRYTGLTFKQYIILQRISKARQLLVDTTDSVTQIAMDSGFGNVNHFIRTFKTVEGITPYQYRTRFHKQSIP